MKAKDIQVGKHYLAKVSNKLVVVKVLEIRETSSYRAHQPHTPVTRYDVLNTSTKRQTTFRSAAKFRKEVQAPLIESERARAAKRQALHSKLATMTEQAAANGNGGDPRPALKTCKECGKETDKHVGFRNCDEGGASYGQGDEQRSDPTERRRTSSTPTTVSVGEGIRNPDPLRQVKEDLAKEIRNGKRPPRHVPSVATTDVGTHVPAYESPIDHHEIVTGLKLHCPKD